MKVQPKSEAEVNQSRRRIFPNGFYDFEIVKGTDKISKIKIVNGNQVGGNEMIELMVKVFDASGESTMVFDYLMDTETMAFKLKHCCEAIGILGKYERGELVADDFVTGVGRLELKIQKSKDPNYPDDKNTVVDYLVPKTAAEKDQLEKNHGIKLREKTASEKLDDSIPF